MDSKVKKHRTLVVGGSSGLGLELADMYRLLGHEVFVTGRTGSGYTGNYRTFRISEDSQRLMEDVRDLVRELIPINTLVYAAGFSQEAYIDELSPSHCLEMVNVGILAPALLISGFKIMLDPREYGKLNIVIITSTSQFTPRAMEPVYCATKSGLAMLGNSVSLDPNIGKVTVVAPAGMKTNFWRKDPTKDSSGFLDPVWVADQIIALTEDLFKYRFAKILRGPKRVEIVETRFE